MSGGKTNRNMLDSNISRWHGHQNSPSTLRRGEAGARHDTNMHVDIDRVKTSETHKKRESAPPSIASMGRGERGECKVTNRLNGCVATR
jgi:hypothetical protein